MSVTYPADPLKPYGDRVEVNPNADGANDEPFVPVYARTGKSTRRNGGKIKTWMILTPVGILVLAGLGAVALGGGEQTTAPLAEPAATAPVVSATPLATPVMSNPAPVARTAPTAAPVLRPAAPVRRAAAAPAPARRSTTVATSRPTTPAPVARVVTPAPAASSPTPMLNMAPMAPTATPAPSPAPAPAATQSPPPFVIVEPVG